jgi:hypothetical protein
MAGGCATRVPQRRGAGGGHGAGRPWRTAGGGRRPDYQLHRALNPGGPKAASFLPRQNLNFENCAVFLAARRHAGYFVCRPMALRDR